MPYYNITNLTDADNLWELTSATNEMSSGWLGIGVLITLAVIIFISMKDYPKKEAFAATGFIIAIIALLMRLLSLISDFVMFIAIITAAAAIISLVFNK